MNSRPWTWFRQFLAGARLRRAMERNEQAAHELDRLLKEVLRE